MKELFDMGDKVEAVVLDIDTSKQLISLGVKQLQPNPWDGVCKKYKVGSVTRGRIVELKNFGAFVKLEEGIDGLIPISELTDSEIEKPEKVISVGDELDVKVLEVSPEEQRIALSRKAGTTQSFIAITYDGEEELSQVVKPNILFSCSVPAWNALKSSIEIREDVQKQALLPIKSNSEILKVLDLILSSALDKELSAFAVTRE